MRTVLLGKTYQGKSRYGKAARRVDLVAHGIVYYTDVSFPPWFHMTERQTVKQFEQWLKRNPPINKAPAT